MERKKDLFFNYFKPSLYLRSFRDVNVSQLKRQGIKLFICDLDNTLVPHFTRLPNKNVLDFFAKLKKADIEIAITSNNITSRVKVFAERAGIKEWHANVKKPFKGTIKKLLKRKNVNPASVVIMGDQIIMDILVANRLKCESILVQPLVSTNYEMSRFNLFLESKIYKNLERNNILKKDVFTLDHLTKKRQLL